MPHSSRSSSRSSDSSHHRHHGVSVSAVAKLGVAKAIQGIQGLMAPTDHHRGDSDHEHSERSSLLHGHLPHIGRHKKKKYADPRTRLWVWSIFTLCTLALLVVVLAFPGSLPPIVAGWLGFMPRDPMAAAMVVLHKAPVFDGHIDLPILVRSLYRNNVTALDLNDKIPGHVDIPRLRQGKVGGFFWSVYVGCPQPEAEGEDFLNSTWRVRDTLEQIDVSLQTINRFKETFQLALSASDIQAAVNNGKIASLLGVEGGHQLGNSLAVLRQYYSLGVRYMTLTHTCHNAFADSCGYLPGIIPRHNGLSEFGKTLIKEMNRLGVLVDLSHTSDATAKAALALSKAPVIWSHSSARAIHDVPRNVPDDVLSLVGTGEGQIDGIVMVNFAPQFVASEGNATVEAVADHVEHIGRVAGKKHVGIGSDFDGINSTPVGLEDVSKYPNLIAELYRRGWNKHELIGLTGGNLLRVFSAAEAVAKELQKANTLPAYDIYSKRTDL
ncbi:membrane dipeptidase-domain-containing protein [Mycena floridula]|nr:membrane dipeptidase-domain-containing protein [Mycena floridula]